MVTLNEKDKKILVIASILGAVTIGIGAFGAHGLKQMANPEQVASFETGVRYQMYHVFALLFLAFSPLSKKVKNWVVGLFLWGILLFSGSIYFLALKNSLPFSVDFLGPITPVGGLLLIVGWLRMAYGFIKLKTEKSA